MTYFPEIRDALAAAGGRSPRRLGSHQLRRASALGLPVVVCLAVVGFFLVSLSGSGPARRTGRSAAVPPAWRLDSERAASATRKLDGCLAPISRSLRSAPGQRVLDTAPPAALGRHLAIFRRPASGTARVSLGQLGRIGVDATDIYVRYARQGVIDGVRYYIVPAGNINVGQVPPRCLVTELRTFTRLAGRLPVSRRAAAIAYERGVLRRRTSPTAGVVIIDNGAGSRGGEFLPASQLTSRDLFSDRAGGGNDAVTKTLLLLPDSVATVSAHYAAQNRPGRVPKPITVTARVHDNFAVFVLHGAWDPPTLTYRSATGAVIADPSAP